MLDRFDESFSATVGGRLRLRFGVLEAGFVGFIVGVEQGCRRVAGS